MPKFHKTFFVTATLALSLAMFFLVRFANAQTPDTIPPAMPTGITATAGAATQATVSWSASTDRLGDGTATTTVSYRLYRDGIYLTTTNTTSYTDTGLTPGLHSYTLVAVDSSGNIYIADTGNNIIRKVSGGNISTVVGNGTAGFTGDGGSATRADLLAPNGLAFDSSGTLYIDDAGNLTIRKVGF